MSKKIILIGGKLATVDDEVYEEIAQYKWGFVGRYAYTQEWTKGTSKNIYMHRMIMGFPSQMEIDHINGDGLDNRKANLRVVSHAQNMANQKSRKNTSSIYKGVSWNKRRGKWESYIETSGKKKHLGYSLDEQEAAKTYDVAAIRIFGVYARPNFTSFGGLKDYGGTRTTIGL